MYMTIHKKIQIEIPAQSVNGIPMNLGSKILCGVTKELYVMNGMMIKIAQHILQMVFDLLVGVFIIDMLLF